MHFVPEMSTARSEILLSEAPAVEDVPMSAESRGRLEEVTSEIQTVGAPAASQPSPQAQVDAQDRAGPQQVQPSRVGWKTRIILTCDGGGIRGYSSALILEALMKKIGRIERAGDPDTGLDVHQTSFAPGLKPETPKEDLKGEPDPDGDGAFVSDFLPCHYFDDFFGTSTGGLIAVMLSRWRMSSRECREQYEKFGREIFQHRRKISILGIPHPKHHKAPLILAVNNLTDAKTPITYNKPVLTFKKFPSPDDICRTAVFANEESRDGKTTYIFRSYEIDPSTVRRENLRFLRNYARPIDHDIWAVCRATTAAPMYFRPHYMGEPPNRYRYSDGGVGTNNLTKEALNEVRFIHGPASLKTVVSFGTGMPRPYSERRKTWTRRLHLGKPIHLLHELATTAREGLTQCEETHADVERTAAHGDGEFRYFRFNVQEGLDKMKLDESKPRTLENIRRYTRAELAKTEVQAELQALAQDLVKHRRARIKDFPSHWERFTRCTTFRCNVEGCQHGGGRPYENNERDEMAVHLQEAHLVAEEQPNALKRRLDACRILPDWSVGPW